MKKTFTFWKSLFLLFALIVGSSNAWAETVTYTVASTSSVNVSGTAPKGSSATFSNTYSTKEQMTKGNSQTLTLSNYNGYQITGLTLSMKSNSDKGAGNLSYSTDGGETWTYIVGSSGSGVTFNNSAWHGSWSTSYVDVTKSPLNIICGTSNIVIKIEATANSLYCQSYTVTYEAAKTLDHITLSGTYPTSFTEQDEFSHEGMTVTAHYDGTEDTEDVTSAASFTGYNMNTIGNQTVTVSYTEGNTTKTATYNITINAGEKYTVSFDPEAGTCGTASLTESAYKGGVTLPSATIELAGWTFAGWAAASQTSTQNRPILYLADETYYPTDNVTLYAVYSLDGIDGTKYQRVTELSQATSASNIIIVNNNKAIDDALGSVDAPTETEGKITPSDNIVWSLSGNNTDGFELTTTALETNKKIGITSIPSSAGNVELTVSNTNWIIEEHTGGENLFVLKNTTNPSNVSNVGVLEYTSSKWKYYCVAASTYKTTNNNSKSKLYIPVKTVYNSNPAAAIIQPTVAFEKGNTTLYLDGTTTYTNAASVTGVDKSVTGYKSSDESVATVAADGTVTAVGIGTAIITAYLDAELGVHKAASKTYEVVVKNTTTIAGLKELADNSDEVSFSADFTGAVITYVTSDKKNAYIQDASAAIYVGLSTANNDLVAGKEINGEISGKVKAPNKIDQISVLSLNATLTDGEIPEVEVKTLAQIVANAASLDGKKVKVNAATVTTALTGGTSGGNGEITDDAGTTKIKLVSPIAGVDVAKDVKGNFTGFVSTYVNGNTTTYRLNLYEQGQFEITHNAPINQPLEYANDVTLNKYAGFSGETTSQELTGAKGTVTYTMAKKTEDDAVIGTINETTGVITLNGNYGTAVITATAAATEETVGGVIQPYKETTTSYELTVSQIFEATFSINGEVKKVRQESAGAAVEVPAVQFLGNKVFVGWGEAADATTTVEMGATYTPTADKTFYALFATATTEVSNVKKSIEPDDTGVPSSYQSGADCTINGITYNSTDFSDNNDSGVLQFKKNSGKIYNKTEMPKIQSIVLTYNNSDPNKNFTVNVGSSENPTTGDEITASVSGSVYTFDCSAKNANYFVIKNGSGAGYLDKIEINYKDEVTTYSDYTSNVGTTNVIIDGNAETIDLATVTDVNALAGVHADEITYTRTMGKLSTLYLPYASTVPSGMKAYKFKNAAGSVLKFEEVDAIEANKPYVLEQEASASKKFSATDVTIDIDNTGKFDDTNWELRGTLEQISNEALLTEAGSGNAYIAQSDGKWHVVTNNGVKVPAFRAYFITSESTEAKIMEMNLGGTTTSISALDNLTDSQLDDDAPIYNLAGQKVTKAYKGVVIQNGKKMLNK